MIWQLEAETQPLFYVCASVILSPSSMASRPQPYDSRADAHTAGLPVFASQSSHPSLGASLCRRRQIIKQAWQNGYMAAQVEALPLSIRLYLRTEAVKRNTSCEALLAEILAGRDPLPAHISELIRHILKHKPFAE